MTPRLTQSVLSSAEDCMLKAQYTLDRPEWAQRVAGSNRALGTGWHAGMELLYVARKFGQAQPTVDDMIGKAIEVFDLSLSVDLYDDTPVEQVKWDDNVPDHATAHSHLDKMIRFYMDNGHAWPEDWRVLDVEANVTLDDDRLGKVKLGADLVLQASDGGIVLCDHKAQPLDAKILTPTGWVEMGRLRLGDQVIDANGFPTQVTGIYPQGIVDVFEVEFSDGSKTRCCDDHLWEVSRTGTDWKARPLSEIRSQKTLDGFRIPLVGKADLGKDDPAIPGYLLGALLGDGCLTNGAEVKFSNADQDVLHRVREELPPGCHLQHSQNSDYVFRGLRDHLRDGLARMGVLGRMAHQKHIPEECFWSSWQYRMDLLRGLMDTDGTANRRSGSAQFFSVSPDLANDVVRLVRSLGGIATTHKNGRNSYYTLDGERISGRQHWAVVVRINHNPFHCASKSNRWEFNGTRASNRRFKSVTPVGKREAQCITVASDTQCYVTDDYIVTHNTAGKPWVEGKAHPRKNVQSPFYLRLARRIWPYAPYYRFVFDVITLPRPKAGISFQRIISDPQEKHEEAIVRRAEAVLATYQAIHVDLGRDLPANPNSTLCNPRFCDFFDGCSFGQALEN